MVDSRPMPQSEVLLNFETGRFDASEPISVRTVQDLTGAWGTPPDPHDDRVVYRTYGRPGSDRETPDLLCASTVIEPGDVNGEFFMTRGHFHVNPARGEWMLTLRGEGALILRDRAGKAWIEPMTAGSVHPIDGQYAHRVANTGKEPLVFVVTWLADCGHDYETIRQDGFGMRITTMQNAG